MRYLVRDFCSFSMILRNLKHEEWVNMTVMGERASPGYKVPRLCPPDLVIRKSLNVRTFD